MALPHFKRKFSQLNPLRFMIKINGRKSALSWVALCSGHMWPAMVLFNDFMAHANGRCTPMEKEKIHLEQDVSFGT